MDLCFQDYKMIVSAGGMITQLIVWQLIPSAINGKTLMEGNIQEWKVTLGTLSLKW
jgi:hypothetical protein